MDRPNHTRGGKWNNDRSEKQLKQHVLLLLDQVTSSSRRKKPSWSQVTREVFLVVCTLSSFFIVGVGLVLLSQIWVHWSMLENGDQL